MRRVAGRDDLVAETDLGQGRRDVHGLPSLARWRLRLTVITDRLARSSVVGKNSFYSPEVGILADGTRYVEIFGGKVSVRALETYEEQSSTTYSASPLGALALGPRLDPFVKRYRLFVGPEDAIAMFGLDGLLVGGRLNPAGVLENASSLTCGVPQGRVHALPHASATFVTAYHPALGRAYCAIIREGSVVTREITAIGPVTWSGKAFVF